MPTKTFQLDNSLPRFCSCPCLVAQKQMQEITSKCPAIKLFGKKISLMAEGESSVISDGDSPFWEREVEEEEEEEAEEKPEESCAAVKSTDTQLPDEEPSAPESLLETKVNMKKISAYKCSAKSKASKTQKEQNDATNSQGKTVKKPDKILPCPRCNSMDTKFCYYNNYNMDQPRHFCKACQRYWTAGGTIRNVPVGAGCRKNKNTASRYRHIAISEALQAARIEGHNGTHCPVMKTNGRVLSFGMDAPICNSMASALNLGDKKVLNGTQNGFYGLDEQRIVVSCAGGKKNGDDCTSRTSTTVSNSLVGGGKAFPEEPCVQNANGFAPPISYLPGVPWPYLWNSTFPPPVCCPPRFPMSFYPSYWNCSIPGPWSIGMPSPQSCSSSNRNASCSNLISSTLGKHSRERDMPKPDDSEEEEPSMHKNGCVLVPKILRIDDPSEAAKSSKWATYGIKNESLGGGGLFKAFQPKSDAKNHIAEASLVLGANPAALSRSINFHERT